MGIRMVLFFSFFISFLGSHSQQLFESQINISDGKKADYRNAVIYLPANYSKSKAYPLVIFTHGMGEAGNNVKKLYKQGLPKVLKAGYRPPFDFIMVAVQHGSFSVEPKWMPGILADCEKRWKIDKSRIYLTGLSAGGSAVYGTQLNFSTAFAKKFAAIVINSAVTHNTNKSHFDWWKQTKTPLWAIVGGADKNYVGKNAYMVNQINKRVPNLATLTVRPGVGHGGWSDIYKGKVKLKGKNMWEWLYQFKRSGGDVSNDQVEEIPSGDDSGDSAPDKAESEVKYVKVNIYKGRNPYTESGWNNWNVGAVADSNIYMKGFKYTDGSASPVKAVLSSSYLVVDNGTDYKGGIAPAGVLRYTSYATHKRTLTISGLSSSRLYTVSLFSSRRSRPANTTIFLINGNRRIVSTNNNHTVRAVFSKLVPDNRGRIVITIDNLNKFNYINGFMIAERSTSGK
jgi:hypothetical protein